MPRNRRNSCLPRCGSRCLGNVCGTNIDTEGIDFTNEKSNLVYMDKVFCFTDATSCPLMFNLNTGGPNQNRFVTELTLEPQNCCCSPCTLEPNAVFNIENSFVVVEYFNTRPPGNLSANQVSLDGYPVDSVDYSNGQYLAKTAGIGSMLQRERCMDAGLPTKAFFLINNVGPWDIRAKYVLEGTVNTGGRNCRFCCKISNADGTVNTQLPPSCGSSFAIPDLSLPCSINGIAPDIRFQFDAGVELVNPTLTLNGGGRCPKPSCGCGCGCECEPQCDRIVDSLGQNFGNNYNPNNLTLTLASKVAIEPTVHIEVVRQTLFCTNACEALIPCDGSVSAAEDEECVNPFLPDCSCGNSNVAGVQSCDYDSEELAPISTTCGSGCGTGCGCNVQWNNNCGCGCSGGNNAGCQQSTNCSNTRRVCSFHGYNGCSW